MFSLCIHNLFLALENYFDVPIDTPMICDYNVDLGYEDDMFNGNIDNCMSIDYFSGYDVSLDPYCI